MTTPLATETRLLLENIVTTSPNGQVQLHDDVFPVHLADGATLYRVMFSTVLQFNDVLDAGKLQNAFSRLLDIGHWRKLGGRLKMKENGDLEVHVPTRFTAERPAMLYAYENFESNIAEHPLAPELPQSADTLSIDSVEEVQHFIRGPTFPTTFNEMIDQGAPQLLVKITAFFDATLLAITAPHVTWDGFGFSSFLQALQLILAGREDEVPPMLGSRHDMLVEMASRYSDNKVDKEAPQGEQQQQSMPQEPRSYNSLCSKSPLARSLSRRVG
ncbi:hypothetical protein HRG_006421 [Hirsutella rhossiliensis]|uniref:Trichothecene 3-O-acetyltransferase n=1 Tax=Hirsutella rhossiliensis TaxID=111463 RepID=A0A9P8MW74_9HYPO|nr:uncharacterized protein HRG_06421 [Hirsutella rhossiliensis]KAH0962319.1 hypothetical protein HRG_06421 [Hirsutella rhossiliensis]